jgi:hypothetical protein
MSRDFGKTELYHSLLQATPLLDAKTKQDTDNAIEEFFKKNTFPSDDWIENYPKTFIYSALPMPSL